MKISFVIACVFLCFVDVQMSEQANKYPDFECYGKRLDYLNAVPVERMGIGCSEDDLPPFSDCEEPKTGMTFLGKADFKCPGDKIVTGMKQEYNGKSDIVVHPLCCKVKDKDLTGCQFSGKSDEDDHNYNIPSDRVLTGFKTKYNLEPIWRSWEWYTCKLTKQKKKNNRRKN
ncbi:unnamed protein product [Lymnaea stagnalis]|uniref:Uncharacterized protein n=1 Tax=Lymnaea stagnalis TaxID=6523 RepID=A0AAV2HAK7_LYMST